MTTTRTYRDRLLERDDHERCAATDDERCSGPCEVCDVIRARPTESRREWLARLGRLANGQREDALAWERLARRAERDTPHAADWYRGHAADCLERAAALDGRRGR